MQVEGKEVERIRWNGEIEAEYWYYVVVCGICGIWHMAVLNGFKGSPTFDTVRVLSVFHYTVNY